VPSGTKVSELVTSGPEDIKAVEIGTKLYDISGLELEIDETLPLSSGTITVITNKECIIAEAEKRLLRLRQISCGKCTFCREGLIQLHTMEKEIAAGKGKAEYTAMMSEIGEAMVFSTPCSVGQTGSDYVLGSLQYFQSEYDAHIKKKNCPANVCKSFLAIYIDPNACEGCEECADVCPADCIEGKAGYIHMIDEFDCTKCGKCIEVCENDAIVQTTGRLPKLPNRLTKCGKFKKR
jgi:ferredoxin